MAMAMVFCLGLLYNCLHCPAQSCQSPNVWLWSEHNWTKQTQSKSVTNSLRLYHSCGFSLEFVYPESLLIHIIWHFLCIKLFGILGRQGGVDQIQKIWGTFSSNICWIRTQKRSPKVSKAWIFEGRGGQTCFWRETSLLHRLQAQTLPHWSSTNRQNPPLQ